MITLTKIKHIECEDSMQHTAGFSQEDNEMVAKMSVQDLLPFALVLVVVGIVIAFGLQVQGDIKADLCDDIDDAAWNATSARCENATGSNLMSSVETNATADAQEGVGNISEKLPTIGLIGGIVVVITLLVGGFMSLRSN